MSRKCRVLEKGQCEITQGYSNNHNAVDIVGANYTLDYVVSHSDGKVVFFQDGYGNMKGSTGNDSYGNCVKIDHMNGYYTLYAHMLKGLLIVFVIQLQKIGWVNLHHLEHGGAFDELEEKKNIVIKNTDTKAYKIYEEIMVDTLKKKIENDKIAASKKAREKAKKSKEDKMKGKKK